MKFLYSIVIILLLLPFNSQSQVINNEINYEIGLLHIYYNGILDPAASLPGEVIAKPQFYVGSTLWSNPCIELDVYSIPYTWTNTDLDYVFTSRSSAAFNSTFDLKFEGYESDASPHCTYKTGDDSYYLGWASFNNIPPTITHGGTRLPAKWHSDDYNPGNGWILPNTTDWDLKLKTAYRYTHGDDCIDPLDFGTLSLGQVYSDRNSTSRELYNNNKGWVDLYYHNWGGINQSGTVFYSFTINQKRDVVISTNLPSITSFNTHLSLYNSCTSFITSNDDITPGSNNLSEISTTLNAGSYVVRVTGSATGDEGIFQLNIASYTPVGIYENEISDYSINVFPNPVKDILKITFNEFVESSLQIEILDILGKSVLKRSISNIQEFEINVNEIPKGTYLLAINDNIGKQYVQKIVIE